MNKASTKIKQQLNLSIPSAIECTIMILISMVDTFAIAQFGSVTITAVGAMISVINFLNLIQKSIQVSNNVTIARLIGQNDNEKVKIATGTSVYIALIFQFLCILVTISISGFLPKIFAVDNICLNYLYIRLIGTIPTAISNILSGHERTMGKSKDVMNIRILSLVLNIILDYLAIKLGYGINGVAWATVIVEIVNMVIVIIIVKNTVVYKIDKNYLKQILNLAKHGIIDRIFDRGGKLVLDIILSRLGTYEYAAHIVLNQIEAFANDFCYGFGIGIATNVGITIGKNSSKDMKELKDVINKIIKVSTIIVPTIILIALIILLPILLKEQQPLLIAYRLIPLVVLYATLMPMRYTYSSIIDGMKELKYMAKVSGITTIIKIVLAYILSIYFGISGVWATFVITYLLIIVMLKRKINKIQMIKEEKSKPSAKCRQLQ